MLNVVSSFLVLGDIVQQVGGEYVYVDILVGLDGDLYIFELLLKDSVLFSKVDVVVVNGLGLEGWLDCLIKVFGFKGELVVVLKGVKIYIFDEEGKMVIDFYVWNSVVNGVLYVQNIFDGLVKVDLEDKVVLISSGKCYIDQLMFFDGWVKVQFSVILLVKCKVLISYDVFGYFGWVYYVIFFVLQGFFLESEVSMVQVVVLIK